jgi:SAM-dependent methyltransferase
MISTNEQTFTSFRDKWEKNTQLAFSETLRQGSDIFNWILNRNGFDTSDSFAGWLSGRERILDGGCGNGRVTALLDRYAPPSTEIVGVDLTAAAVARENLRYSPRVQIEQGDLLADLSHLGKFDLIYCQEVLHHTSDPKRSFLNLCSLLADKGEIAIYVYKQKAPIREYADDYIRDRISGLAYSEAMSLMTQVTELGKVLSELKVSVNVPEVKVLGIEAGSYDIQRFLYHYFLKCFWNPDLTYQENVAINYDWYHPQLCTRHTLDEIKGWFQDANLTVVHYCVDPYGITVRGIKK